MKSTLLVLLSIVLLNHDSYSQSAIEDSITIRAIYDEILTEGECYENLRVLCKDIGNRLSGSENAEKAVLWGEDLLNSYGFDNVRLQEVMVPKWERGYDEIGQILHKDQVIPVGICALGGSIGCERPVIAEVIEVKYLSELEALGEENIKGKIVFFNRALDPLLINTGAAYGGAYDQRSSGASTSAKHGAVACLVRSLTLSDDDSPHTGAMSYDDNYPEVPAAAISTSGAKLLSELLKENKDLKFEIQLNCKAYPDVPSSNVIGEILGSENPEKIIVVGGHLDSWDVGEGAHDDGAGIVQSIEALRCLNALGIKPKNTIRVVLFMNEENGNNGGKTYAEVVEKSREYHVAAIESDAGGFTPRGFNIDGNEMQAEKFKSWAPLFEPYELHKFKRGFTGVDISPLRNDTIALFGLSPDSQRYFDFHHSDRDTFENVHKRELELGAAALCSLLYLIDKHGLE